MKEVCVPVHDYSRGGVAPPVQTRSRTHTLPQESLLSYYFIWRSLKYCSCLSAVLQRNCQQLLISYGADFSPVTPCDSTHILLPWRLPCWCQKSHFRVSVNPPWHVADISYLSSHLSTSGSHCHVKRVYSVLCHAERRCLTSALECWSTMTCDP